MYLPEFRTECRPREVDSDLLPPRNKCLMICLSSSAALDALSGDLGLLFPST